MENYSKCITAQTAKKAFKAYIFLEPFCVFCFFTLLFKIYMRLAHKALNSKYNGKITCVKCHA